MLCIIVHSFQSWHDIFCIAFQDQEVLLFEKERKEAEEALRRRLAAETQAALAQQEKDLAALIGRLEVGYVHLSTDFFKARLKLCIFCQ